MEQPILLDTDILVDFFRGYSKAIEFVNAHVARIILSSIVVAELYAGVKGEQEQTAFSRGIANSFWSFHLSGLLNAVENRIVICRDYRNPIGRRGLTNTCAEATTRPVTAPAALATSA
jgi:hypothetical protein